MGYVLNFIIISIIILWVIRLLLRLVFPAVVRNIFTKMQNQASGQQQRSAKPEGSISIDYMPEKDKKQGNADKLGEFVEYEEVKK